VLRASKLLSARKLIVLLFAAALIPAAVATTAAADQGGVPNDGVSSNDHAAFGQSHKHVCDQNTPDGVAHCDSQVNTNKDGVTPAATTTYTSGYQPADLQSAYALPSGNGAGKTVAIVDAYDNPNAASDLAAYRSRFGLPAVTFTKVNQTGGSTPPKADVGWGQEIALDLDMASAICPNCNILLVEANSSSFSDLVIAVDKAASLGAYAISNSYGGGEFSTETSWESHYNHPGIAITVSSGDNGYGVEFPAASQYVTAVGGTSLTKSGTTFSETAWNGAGSGCSRYVPKPSWQSVISSTTCSKRAVADVSAVANPSTGVAVYDSYGSSGGANWLVFGGTSVASPIVASVYALAGNGASNSYPYSHTGGLHDVKSGSNGRCRFTPSLCTAGTGWDGPTGLGTPNGVTAF
jgi:subtilase family serine protease